MPGKATGRAASISIALLALIGTAELLAQGLTKLAPAERAFVTVDAPRVVLRHVTLVDGTGSPAKPDQTIVLEGSRITWVGASGMASIPADARVLELPGHTVIPGMVGLHDHMFYGGGGWPYVHQPVSAPRLYLASGVTTVRTTGTNAPYQDFIMKRAIDQGEIVGPRMYVTGPHVQGPGGDHGFMQVVATPEAARREVAYWAEEGASWVKAYDRIARRELDALVDEAHKRGLKVTGHLCSIGYREAVAAGMDNIEHGLYANQEYDPGKKPDQCPGVKMSVFESLDIDGPAVRATIKDMVERRVALTSTIVILESLMGFRPPLEQRNMDVLYPPAKDAYLEARATYAARKGPAALVTEPAFQKMLAFELAFARAGGLLGAGVDPSGIGGVPAGLGNQRNYELFLEAGFTPIEAIQVLTANGAKILGAFDRFGTVSVGKSADLVVIKGDPLARPAEIRNVTLVFKEGVGYDSPKLIDSVRGMVGLR